MFFAQDECLQFMHTSNSWEFKNYNMNIKLLW